MRVYGDKRVFSDGSRETFGRMEAEPRIDPAASASVCPHSLESRTSGPTVATMDGPTRAPSLAGGELQGCGHESDQSCIRSPTDILVRTIGGSTGSSRSAWSRATVTRSSGCGFELDRLKRVIEGIRRTGERTATKTLIVLGSARAPA